MPVIVETAYPRLSPTPTDAELETWFTPTPADLAFADRHSRRSQGRRMKWAGGILTV
jgi:hypothetical protein